MNTPPQNKQTKKTPNHSWKNKNCVALHLYLTHSYFAHIVFLCNIYCFTAPQANLRDTFPFTSVSAVWPLVYSFFIIAISSTTSQKGPMQTHFKLLDKPQIYLAEVTKENILDKVTDYIKDGQLQ